MDVSPVFLLVVPVLDEKTARKIDEQCCKRKQRQELGDGSGLNSSKSSSCFCSIRSEKMPSCPPSGCQEGICSIPDCRFSCSCLLWVERWPLRPTGYERRWVLDKYFFAQTSVAVLLHVASFWCSWLLCMRWRESKFRKQVYFRGCKPPKFVCVWIASHNAHNTYT